MYIFIFDYIYTYKAMYIFILFMYIYIYTYKAMYIYIFILNQL